MKILEEQTKPMIISKEPLSCKIEVDKNIIEHQIRDEFNHTVMEVKHEHHGLLILEVYL